GPRGAAAEQRARHGRAAGFRHRHRAGGAAAHLRALRASRRGRGSPGRHRPRPRDRAPPDREPQRHDSRRERGYRAWRPLHDHVSARVERRERRRPARSRDGADGTLRAAMVHAARSHTEADERAHLPARPTTALTATLVLVTTYMLAEIVGGLAANSLALLA